MIIDRSRLKKIALWALLVLLLALGACYILQGSHSVESGTKTRIPAVSQKPTKQQTASGFCSRYRMEREQVRSQEVGMLNGVVNEGGGEDQARSKAMQRLVQISSNMENEMKIENLVRCYGARDCVAMVDPDSATLIIASSTMNEEKVADIKSKLSKITGCQEDEISLIFRD